MVISCPECSTRFRVDESKIPERGAKIRCARCKHIFAVAHPIPEPAPVYEETIQTPEEPPAWVAPTPRAVSAPEDASEPEDDFATADAPAPALETSRATEPIDEEDYGFDDPSSSGVGAGTNDELDLSSFESAEKDDNDEDDFSFGEEYGNVSLGGDIDTSAEDEPFSFGEPVQASAKHKSEIKQEPFSFSPAAKTNQPSPDPLAASFTEDPSLDDISLPPIEGEFNLGSAAPPLPPRANKSASRGPVSIVILIILALILAICVAGGVLVWKSGPEGLEKVLSTLMGQGSATEMKGNIRLTNLQGSFITNRQEGELFVIQGVAVNGLSEAQAAIQVKGVIFDKSGKQLMQKTIFCGNPISDNDLRKLPYSKMEEIMGNQFGESLANLNVTSGQSIPFTIVFRKLPKTLSEFVVDVADSKPAAQ